MLRVVLFVGILAVVRATPFRLNSVDRRTTLMDSWIEKVGFGNDAFSGDSELKDDYDIAALETDENSKMIEKSGKGRTMRDGAVDLSGVFGDLDECDLTLDEIPEEGCMLIVADSLHLINTIKKENIDAAANFLVRLRECRFDENHAPITTRPCYEVDAKRNIISFYNWFSVNKIDDRNDDFYDYNSKTDEDSNIIEKSGNGRTMRNGAADLTEVFGDLDECDLTLDELPEEGCMLIVFDSLHLVNTINRQNIRAAAKLLSRFRECQFNENHIPITIQPCFEIDAKRNIISLYNWFSDKMVKIDEREVDLSGVFGEVSLPYYAQAKTGSGSLQHLTLKVDVFEPEPLLTSTQPPTTAPSPVPNCKLPLYPATDPAVRFGTTFGSRVEYEPPLFRKKFDFSISIKTVSTEGIILYVHDQKHIDFVALYLNDGRVHFSFNCGSGAVSLKSDKPVNDGEWHSVRFSRVATRGKLVVDREPPVSGESKGNTKTINVDPPLYLGGIDPKISNNTKLNLGLNNTFEGCLKDFNLNNKSVKTQSRAVGVVPCFDRVEAGSFFSADGGYIKYADKFRVGVEIEIKLDIKPRDLSGLLVSVHAKKDYLLLQMVDGTVRFSVDNGKGEIWAAYTPPMPHYFCDGQWHSILAVKSKNVVSLSVDGFFVEPGIGQSSGTDTKNPLFIGGHPPTARPLRGLLTNKQFTGCIRNLEINATQVALNRLPTFGNVTQSICPTI